MFEEVQKTAKEIGKEEVMAKNIEIEITVLISKCLEWTVYTKILLLVLLYYTLFLSFYLLFLAPNVCLCLIKLYKIFHLENKHSFCIL